MHYVCSAKYLEKYRVSVEFEDGTRKIVDLEKHLEGPVFEPLRNVSYFRLVSFNPDIETIVWPNDADFSPDFLYEIGKQVDAVRKPAARSRKRHASTGGRAAIARS